MAVGSATAATESPARTSDHSHAGRYVASWPRIGKIRTASDPPPLAAGLCRFIPACRMSLVISLLSHSKAALALAVRLRQGGQEREAAATIPAYAGSRLRKFSDFYQWYAGRTPGTQRAK